MQQLIKKREQGFTLLELLIVIVIIGILAVIIVPGLASGPKRARDAQRKADLRSIKNALETYYNDNGHYPTAAEYTTASGGSSSDVLESYLADIPTDPNDDSAYTYTPAPASCASGACTSYTLSDTLELDGTTYTVDSIN